MKLSFITEAVQAVKLPLWEFIYPDYTTDPSPKAVVLGFYEHPRTGSRLMAGVNVRLLDTLGSEKLLELFNAINQGSNTKQRVRILRRHAKGIFDRAYRTYDTSKMKSLHKSSILGSLVQDKPVKQDVQSAPVKQDKPAQHTPQIAPVAGVAQQPKLVSPKPVQQTPHQLELKKTELKKQQDREVQQAQSQKRTLEPTKVTDKPGTKVHRPRRTSGNADEIY